MSRKKSSHSKKHRYSLRTEVIMLLKQDSILGRNLRLFGRVLIGFLICALLVWVLVLAIRLFGAPLALDPAETSQAATEAARQTRTGDFLEFWMSFLSLVIAAITAIQVYMMKDISHLEMSHNIFEDNQLFRRDMHKAHQQLMDLAQELKKSSNPCRDFDNIYLLPYWEDLRAFAFHYEYMGYLVLREQLNFDIVFDTVAFPNWLITDEDAKKVIHDGRFNTPDFWNGSEYLYKSYELRRKYNQRKLRRKKLRRHSLLQRMLARTGLCKNPVLARRLQEYRDAKKAFQLARNEWKHHFDNLP